MLNLSFQVLPLSPSGKNSDARFTSFLTQCYHEADVIREIHKAKLLFALQGSLGLLCRSLVLASLDLFALVLLRSFIEVSGFLRGFLCSTTSDISVRDTGGVSRHLQPC